MADSGSSLRVVETRARPKSPIEPRDKAPTASSSKGRPKPQIANVRSPVPEDDETTKTKLSGIFQELLEVEDDIEEESEEEDEMIEPKRKDTWENVVGNLVHDYKPSIEEYMMGSFYTLQDILNRQLKKKICVSRGTQTDWTWVKMAVRWRHAKLMSPSPESEDRCLDEKEESEQAQPVFRIDPSKEQLIPEQDEEKQRKMKKRRDDYLEKLSAVRKTMKNDVAVDTSDLEFDPFDPTMRYTKVEHTNRLSTYQKKRTDRRKSMKK